ncbi:MAG: nucleotidyltransferase domain-containing protein [Promethearchaeota archaeon]
MLENKYYRLLPRYLQDSLSRFRDIRGFNNLIEFIYHVMADYDVKVIALYGSHARNIADEYSDIDLFLVATDFPKNIFERLDAMAEYKLPIDYKCYTLEEFNEMIESWDLTLLEVLNDNCILHDPENLMAPVQERFSQLVTEKKLIRHENYWKLDL